MRKFFQFVKDAIRMIITRLLPYEKFGHDYREICEKIIRKCWNGRFFQTSSKGFTEFYIRDFAFCAESLKRLGYAKEVRASLIYALEQFRSHGAIRTKIARSGLPMDIFHIGPDSLALLIRTFIVTKNQDLARKFKRFLNTEIKRYFETIVDKTTGLVKGGYFSSVKDHSVRDSSLYDNAMIAYLRDNLDKLKLSNPFKKFEYKKKLRSIFWNGSYFRDNMASDEVTGDANIFPFWLGLFKNKLMQTKSFESLERSGLADPYPLKYSANPKGKFLRYSNFFAPNYQGDTIWTQNGLIYLKLLAKTNKKKFQKYFDIYKGLIEKNRNFIELFHRDGRIYKSFFYKADEGLLWCSMFLDLANGQQKSLKPETKI